MKTNIYIIRDTVLNESGQPYLYKNDAVAMRSFQMSLEKMGKVNDLKIDDLSLQHIGSFDTETCTGKFFKTPKIVKLCLDLEEETDERSV